MDRPAYVATTAISIGLIAWWLLAFPGDGLTIVGAYLVLVVALTTTTWGHLAIAARLERDPWFLLALGGFWWPWRKSVEFSRTFSRRAQDPGADDEQR